MVDDDPRTLKRVRDSLADEGYEPTVTGDPEQVARLIEEVDPHVVLLDLMLPGTDGIELMQDILTVRDTPIIFLSAYSRDDLVAQAFEMGAADYIIKPSSPTELAARVKAAAREQAGSTRSPRARTPNGGPLRARGPGHQLRRPHGDRRRQPREPDPHRVQPVGRAVGQRGDTPDPRTAAAQGVGDPTRPTMPSACAPS